MSNKLLIDHVAKAIALYDYRWEDINGWQGIGDDGHRLYRERALEAIKAMQSNKESENGR